MTIRNFIICIVILLCSNLAIAQTGNFSFGASVYPNFSGSQIVTDSNMPIGIEIVKPSISTTLFVDYGLTDKFSVYAGIGYLNNGEQTEKVKALFAQPEPDQIEFFRVVYSRNYIEVPVHLKYQFGKRFYVTGGVSTIVKLGHKNVGKLYYSDRVDVNRSTAQEDFYKNINGMVNVGVGFNYFKNDQIELFVQPSTQIGILGVANDVLVNRRDFSFGVSLGLVVL